MQTIQWYIHVIGKLENRQTGSTGFLPVCTPVSEVSGLAEAWQKTNLAYGEGNQTTLMTTSKGSAPSNIVFDQSLAATDFSWSMPRCFKACSQKLRPNNGSTLGKL